jgi:excisionase family DNA binding protein
MAFLAPIDLEREFEQKGRGLCSLHDLLCLPMQRLSLERDGTAVHPSCLATLSHAYTAIPVGQASSGNSTTYSAEMIREKQLRAIKLGRSGGYRIRRSDLHELLRQRETREADDLS